MTRILRCLLPLVAATAAATAASWAPGDDVMGRGADGRWYFAEVLEARDGRYRLDLLGVGKEWVEAAAVRARTPEEVAAVLGEPKAPPVAQADARVAKALAELGLPARPDEDGDYRLELPTGGGRTQLAWILSGTQSWGEMEIREVWSPAFRTAGGLDLALARRLLTENHVKKLGGWRLAGHDGGETAVFAVHVDANAGATVLRDVLQLVTAVADGMEAEVTGKDDL